MRSAALVMLSVLAFGLTGAATAFNRFQSNIASADVEPLLGDRPEAPKPDPDDPNAGTPVNILIMGSDSRRGNESVAADEVEGQRSDTTILAHVSADRTRVEMVSIPRDSLVDIPECDRADGTSSPAQYDAMFNSAFSIGGESGSVTDAAACTVRTVEATTDIYVDHFVVVDMTGFIDMVDALGGVPMCIPHDMSSDKADLSLTAGRHRLDGRTALAFARARTGQGLGDGSDTGRIGRQQELLAATAREVLGKNILTDVPQLVRFLSAATRSLTVSSGLSNIGDMAGLAYSLRQVPGSGISFRTIPYAGSVEQPGRVVWTDEAQQVWAAIDADEPIDGPVKPRSPAKPSGGATAGAGGATEDEADEPRPASTKKPGVDSFTVEDLTPTACGPAGG